MENRKTIYLIHYHFIRGGVTTVIKNQINILKDNYNIVLIGSDKMGENFIIKTTNVKAEVKYINCEDLEYQYYNKLNFENFYKSKIKILDFLYNNIDVKNGILWVHNYHLGKNVSFTDALIQFITDTNILTFLQIHDFPECGRWENFRFLKKFVKNSLYPVKENINYILINKDDFTRIVNTQIDNKNIFYLPNPVDLNLEIKKDKIYPESDQNIANKNTIYSTISIDNNNNINNNTNKANYTINIINNNLNGKKGEIRFNYNQNLFLEKLYKFANEEGFNFVPEIPVVLYPVRTIRRKNILEAILFARVYKNRFNLLVTLPANSDKERKYEKIVLKCFKNQNFNGLWGISKKYPQYFDSIISISSFFISTSVLEGFGLMFIDAMAKNKPFFAKRINVLKDFPFITENNIYDFINVPISKEIKVKYKKLYYKKFESLPVGDYLKQKLMSEFDAMLKNNYLDFSYFTYEDQYDILQNDELITQIKDLNQHTFLKFESFLKKMSFNRDRLDLSKNYIKNLKDFSIQNYKIKVLKIISEKENNIIDNNYNYIYYNCRKVNSLHFIKKENYEKNVSKSEIYKNINFKNINNENNNIEFNEIERAILKSYTKLQYLRLLFD